VLDGAGGFVGLLDRLRHMRDDEGGLPAGLGKYLAEQPCRSCGGARLRPESRAVRVAGTMLPAIASSTVTAARAWVAGLRMNGVAKAVLEPIRRELLPKLDFLDQVGLGYLTLERRGDTLSGGEAQRIRRAPAARCAARDAAAATPVPPRAARASGSRCAAPARTT
jgi:excinuclease ABC subunit A